MHDILVQLVWCIGHVMKQLSGAVITPVVGAMVNGLSGLTVSEFDEDEILEGSYKVGVS